MGLRANQVLRGVAEPTLDEVMRLVEPADTGGHWYWLGDFATDGVSPVPVIKRDGCSWVAIRLLLSAPKGRVRRVNRCGLRTCVNPAHWAAVFFEDGVVLTDFDGVGWRRA
jgi:hypothetical protein